MTKLLGELRERLLRAGVAPRHVRRYLTELAEHLADLTAEEERAGHSHRDAVSAALVRLGGVDELVRAMTEQRQFLSWSVRAPWAIFALAPLLWLAGLYSVALLILWSGWKIFLPAADTPFVPIRGLASYYLGIGRLLYFSSPILAGWAMGLVAVRQRLTSVWSVAGFCMTALIGATVRVQAGRTAVPGGFAHIRIDLTLTPSVQGIGEVLLHTCVLLSLAALPYLVWRLQRAYSYSA